MLNLDARFKPFYWFQVTSFPQEQATDNNMAIQTSSEVGGASVEDPEDRWRNLGALMNQQPNREIPVSPAYFQPPNAREGLLMKPSDVVDYLIFPEQAYHLSQAELTAYGGF